MQTIWFCFVAFMIVMYVLLDGFDLGVGILHRFVARSDEERRMALATIGPVWDGNEVWLLAAGGTLYFAFPLLYASAFSGFYLPLNMVLWLLMGRGISIELRSHLEAPIWRSLWDSIFVLSSFLLALFFGVALGNVVRGVPLDESGRFFAPMWLGGRHSVGVLDLYTVLVGLTAVVALTLQGASWLNLKTSGPVQHRSQRTIGTLVPVQLLLTLVLTVVTFRIQPVILQHLNAQPWRYVFPLLALAGLCGLFWFPRRGGERSTFYASCAYLAGMLGAVVAGVYPLVLPALDETGMSLNIHNAAAPLSGLRLGLYWWIPGMLIAMAYSSWMYRKFAGKVGQGETSY
ncbi:MAG TPA: cytochrome d ubiquinol oxidase subunit II [Candidatus Krumholzibacteria bacterium]|nr:cytochrome d ubiquinol oxidase subunit II [Candidatus Krumholzibacteria bacterium]